MKKIIIALLLFISGLYFYQTYFGRHSTKIGALAPEFNATLLSGQTFTLTDLRGKYVLIDFWGSWCAPCRKEFPELRGLYETFNNQSFVDGNGFEIISIALEKREGRAAGIIESQNLSWPYHIEDVSRIVLASSYAQKYGVTELPTKILLNPKGEVLGTNLSFDAMSDLLTSRM